MHGTYLYVARFSFFILRVVLVFRASFGSFITKAAWQCARTADSWGSSVVWYMAQVFLWNFWTEEPSWVVATSKKASILSVCNQSLTNACHIVKSKSMSKMISLWGEGRSPLKTGIAHCILIRIYVSSNEFMDIPEADLRSPWLQGVSSLMHFCGTFKWFHGQMLEQLNICLSNCVMILIMQVI